MARDKSLHYAHFIATYVLPIMGLIPAVVPLFFTKNGTESLNINIAIMSIFVYQAIFLIIMFLNSYQVRKYLNELRDNESIIAGYIDSDKLFRRLADERSKFDKKAFDSVFKEENSDEEELDTLLADYLTLICNTAVRIIAKRKMVAEEELSANIKLFRNRDGEAEYFFAVSSEHYIDHRIDINSKRSSEYKVSENACFQEILNNRGRKFFINNDMGKFITHEKSADVYPEPNTDALKHYKKCIVAPISEYLEDVRNVSGNRNEPHNRKYAIGMLCIDTNSDRFDFDMELDVSIIREMAINAHSICHQKELLLKAKAQAVLYAQSEKL